MKSANRALRSRAGFSVVELLVAMTLGLVLIGGTVVVFAANSRSAKLNTEMTDIQESARFLLSALSRDIRLAGYQGCLDPNQSVAKVRAKDAPTADLRRSLTSGSVVVAADDWSPAPPPGFTLPGARPAVPGTHALVLQYGEPVHARLTARMSDAAGAASTEGPLVLDRDLGLQAGDLAIIANCDTADLFKVSGVQMPAVGTPGSTLLHAATHNVGTTLTQAYGDTTTNSQTTVMRFQALVYYIGDTGLINDEGDAIRALYRRSHPYDDVTNPPVELVQGVENLRVAFGMRDADGRLEYVLATDADYDAARVETIRLGLLMTSAERVLDTNDVRTYTLAGQTIAAQSGSSNGLTHAPDRRLRLALDTTVRIRNRRNGS